MEVHHHPDMYQKKKSSKNIFWSSNSISANLCIYWR